MPRVEPDFLSPEALPLSTPAPVEPAPGGSSSGGSSSGGMETPDHQQQVCSLRSHLSPPPAPSAHGLLSSCWGRASSLSREGPPLAAPLGLPASAAAPPRLCWCWLLGPLQEGSLGPPPPSLGRRAACVLRGALQKQHPASWSALLTQEEPWPISVSSVSAWRSAENGAFGGFVSPCPSPVGVFLLRLAERDFPLAAQGSSMSDQGSAGRQNILRSWFE